MVDRATCQRPRAGESGTFAALLFDYDGVLVDSEAVRADALVALLGEEGVALATADLADLFGAGGPALVNGFRALLARRGGAHVDVRDLERRLAERVAPLVARLGLRPGARELAEAARDAGWRVGIATGRARDEVVRELARLGVLHLFEVVVSTGRGMAPKPAPDVFLELARRLAVEPAAAVVVEDSLPGCLAALDAGMAVVVCPTQATESCAFPVEAHRVGSLADVSVDGLVALLVGRRS